MSSIEVNVRPEVLKWVLSQVEEKDLGKMAGTVHRWLEGEKTPTLRQIEMFCRKTHIPMGYFYLAAPPDENLSLLKFRTVDSARPSRNLIETIYQMERIQDWMRIYRLEMGFDRLPLVGSVRGETDPLIIAGKIRRDLQLPDAWFFKSRSIGGSFRRLRARLQYCGFLVMISGIVENNTHRPLNMDEFRGFAMLDDWVPLIFINSADLDGGVLFSLLHEAVHIWMGRSDLYNDRTGFACEGNETEEICNAVAGEILVPGNIFLELWDKFEGDPEKKIRDLAQYFRCSPGVIARRAFDYEKINRETVEETVRSEIHQKESRKSAGKLGPRLDEYFVKALAASVEMGRTSPTKAFRLTGTNRKTFFEMAKRIQASS